MSQIVRVQVGPLTLAIEGALDGAPTPAVQALCLLPPAPPNTSVDLRIIFEPALQIQKRATRPVGRHPLYAAPHGLVVVDHLGREAFMPLGALATRPVRIDPSIDLHTLLVWVQLPLFRLALHGAGGGLARLSVFDLAGRRVGIIAPARTGKTRLMLTMLRQGARLVGDDWVAVAADGKVAMACRVMVQRDEARSDAGRHSLRLAVVRGLRWLSRRTAGARRISITLAQAADLTWRWGQQLRDVGVVMPNAGVAEEVRHLDEIVLLRTPTSPATSPPLLEAVPEMVSAAGITELPQQSVLESAYRMVHPGRLPADAWPGPLDDHACIERAVASAQLVRSFAYDGTTADVARIARRLTEPSSPGADPEGQGEIVRRSGPSEDS